MKQSDSQRAALDAALSRIDLNLTERQVELLLAHLNLVIEKNKVLNLTRITSDEDAVILHIEDSLSIFKDFSQLDGCYCDIGTGGGFPGIPLGIVTGKTGYLMESVKKKAFAVEEFINALNLSDQLSVLPLRSEEYALENPGSMNIVVARAVSSLPTLLELASPLLALNGSLVAMRGVDSEEDISTAVKVGNKLGFEFSYSREFEIGNGLYQRSVCVFNKVKEPEVKLPRRPGMAAKKPYS